MKKDLLIWWMEEKRKGAIELEKLIESEIAERKKERVETSLNPQ